MVGDIRGKTILCLIGKGHNGGGRLVAARHLANWGADPYLVLAEPVEKLRPTTVHQFQIVNAMGIPSANSYPQFHPVVIIDALLGYRGQGNPRGSIARLVRKTKDSPAKIIALDIPSGLDATTGDPNKPCIEAQATLTLALPKTGLMTSQAKPYVGELYLADIGIPKKVLKEALKCDDLVYDPSPKITRLQEKLQEH